MRIFISLAALALAAAPSLVSAAGASTVWVVETYVDFQTQVASYVSCVGAQECYCGDVLGYVVPDGCQTSAPASVTSAFAANNVQGEITGAVYYSGRAWVSIFGPSGVNFEGQATGTRTIAAPTGTPSVFAAASSTTSQTGHTTQASSGASTATSSAASTASTAVTKNAAAPAVTAGAGFMGLMVGGIAAGAFLL
jgi:cobalamin biosynthesis Mg chelatase CobN